MSQIDESKWIDYTHGMELLLRFKCLYIKLQTK